MKRRQILTYLCFVGLLAIWLIGFLALNVDAEPPRPEHTKATMPEITLDELEAAENELIEAALLARSTKLEDVTITFYCCEERPHICGSRSPHGERGLKSLSRSSKIFFDKSLPTRGAWIEIQADRHHQEPG